MFMKCLVEGKDNENLSWIGVLTQQIPQKEHKRKQKRWSINQNSPYDVEDVY
jgi:hypothetical protein